MNTVYQYMLDWKPGAPLPGFVPVEERRISPQMNQPGEPPCAKFFLYYNGQTIGGGIPQVECVLANGQRLTREAIEAYIIDMLLRDPDFLTR